MFCFRLLFFENYLWKFAKSSYLLEVESSCDCILWTLGPCSLAGVTARLEDEEVVPLILTRCSGQGSKPYEFTCKISFSYFAAFLLVSRFG